MSDSCNPMDYGPPGSSVHGILQARILEWVAMPSSRGSSQPKDGTQVSCITGIFFATEPSAEPKFNYNNALKKRQIVLGKPVIGRVGDHIIYCSNWDTSESKQGYYY